jgi:hypothetical protein
MEATKRDFPAPVAGPSFHGRMEVREPGLRWSGRELESRLGLEDKNL